jgi:hypothetical protein
MTGRRGFGGFLVLLAGAFLSHPALAAESVGPACESRSNAALRDLTGYMRKVFEGDGVAIGWALDRGDGARAVEVRFYIDGTAEDGGTLAGQTRATTIDRSINWKYHVEGDHGFAFRIPDRWRDGVRRRLFAQAVSCDGRLSPPFGVVGDDNAFTLSPASKTYTVPVTDTHCLAPQTRCPAVASNFLPPHFPAATGWSDGQNYFRKWGCRSEAGYNDIARLNIIPLGTFGPHFQKDSLDVDARFASPGRNGATLYFTTAAKDQAPRWGLRKAIYSAAKDKWEIFSVLDNPDNAGGVSSWTGSGTDIIFNDYSLPGWGPASPLPGSQTKVPGVAEVSASPNRPVYPLVGSGPLGLSAMVDKLYPAETSAGVEGRTCVHMNPKLLDYDAQGVPHTLIANLWQKSPRGLACELPGEGVRLPAPGNYIYRYKGPGSGWQLDREAGLIADALHDDAHNQFMLTPKLFVGTAHTLVVATWDGLVETIDLGRPKSDATRPLLDCKASGAHFGEAAGGASGIYFLGAEADMSGAKRKYNLANDVFPSDIYYLSRK